MKNIIILTVVAMAASSIGCCGGPRMSWFRGDACSDCATYETAPGIPTTQTLNGYAPGVVIPSLPELPGPAPTNP